MDSNQRKSEFFMPTQRSRANKTVDKTVTPVKVRDFNFKEATLNALNIKYKRTKGLMRLLLILVVVISSVPLFVSLFEDSSDDSSDSSFLRPLKAKDLLLDEVIALPSRPSGYVDFDDHGVYELASRILVLDKGKYWVLRIDTPEGLNLTNIVKSSPDAPFPKGPWVSYANARLLFIPSTGWLVISGNEAHIITIDTVKKYREKVSGSWFLHSSTVISSLNALGWTLFLVACTLLFLTGSVFSVFPPVLFFAWGILTNFESVMLAFNV